MLSVHNWLFLLCFCHCRQSHSTRLRLTSSLHFIVCDSLMPLCFWRIVAQIRRASSRFQPTVPPTVASGRVFIVTCVSRRRFKLLDAHTFVHQLPPGTSMHVCWRAHASCQLFHRLLYIWKQSRNVEKTSSHLSVESCQHGGTLFCICPLFFNSLETLPTKNLCFSLCTMSVWIRSSLERMSSTCTYERKFAGFM